MAYIAISWTEHDAADCLARLAEDIPACAPSPNYRVQETRLAVKFFCRHRFDNTPFVGYTVWSCYPAFCASMLGGRGVFNQRRRLEPAASAAKGCWLTPFFTPCYDLRGFTVRSDDPGASERAPVFLQIREPQSAARGQFTAP